MDENRRAFFEILRAAMRGEKCSLENQAGVLDLAKSNSILPMIADALTPEESANTVIVAQARNLVIGQAQRTADFLFLLEDLEQRGLRPIVVKGIVCRSLYPKPELRCSADEDLWIPEADYERYRTALVSLGYNPEKEGSANEKNYEIGFCNSSIPLLLELHTSLFPPDSEAFGDCNRLFEGASEKTTEITYEGVVIRTLAPTDHLLFLLCHAYKHFLHSGIGLRQLCDIVRMAEQYREEIDWPQVRASCDLVHITQLCAAMFRIGENNLGVLMPKAFSDVEVDESALLEDILSGGRYIDNDIDRAHSSTLTLEAVSAARSGRRRKGALHSVFLPLDAMRGHFPYLRKFPWLLPVAWIQRIYRYLARKRNPNPVSPSRSLQIARERIELLKEYQLIEE